MLLHGRRIVFTGASAPLGVAVAEAFLALGAELVAADLRRTTLVDLRTALANHERLRVAECDIEDRDALGALFASVARGGSVDVLVHAPSVASAMAPAIRAALDAPFGEGARIVLAVTDPALAALGAETVERGEDEAARLGFAINAVVPGTAASTDAGVSAADVAKVAVWLAGPAPLALTGSCLRLVGPSGIDARADGR